MYGSVVCIADQTDIIYTCVRVGQPGDGFAVAVKYAFEPVGFCANGRPLRVFIYGDVVHQPGVDRSFAAVYGLGKPAQVPFIGDLVVIITAFLGRGVVIQRFHRIRGSFAQQRQQRVGGGVIARKIQPCQFVIGKAFFGVVNVGQRLFHCRGVVLRHFVRQGVDHRLHLCRGVGGCRGFRRRHRGRRFRSVRRSRFLWRRCGGRLCRGLRGRCCHRHSRFLRRRLLRQCGFFPCRFRRRLLWRRFGLHRLGRGGKK